jgi:glucokinase
MDMRNIVGVDIGGTKVAAGVVDGRGQIGYRTRAAMTPTGSAEEGFAAVKGVIENALAHARENNISISGIGVCAPGPLDPRSGVVLNPPNLPCWRDFALADALHRSFGMTARVDNDANAAALAETLWGAASGYKYVFYATLGTGIGSGIVIDGEIYYGRTGGAAEGGHMSIDYRGPLCACGKRGCIEAYCSGPSIARRARERIRETAYTGPLTQSPKGIDGVSAEDLGRAFGHGDRLAGEVLAETATLLAVWLGNIVDLLDPDVIVLGGGVSELMESRIDDISKQVRRWSVNPRAGDVPIVRAKYGAESGIAGAAALLLASSEQFKDEPKKS